MHSECIIYYQRFICFIANCAIAAAPAQMTSLHLRTRTLHMNIKSEKYWNIGFFRSISLPEWSSRKEACVSWCNAKDKTVSQRFPFFSLSRFIHVSLNSQEIAFANSIFYCVFAFSSFSLRLRFASLDRSQEFALAVQCTARV